MVLTAQQAAPGFIISRGKNKPSKILSDQEGERSDGCLWDQGADGDDGPRGGAACGRHLLRARLEAETWLGGRCNRQSQEKEEETEK